MHQPPPPGGLLETFILPELGLSISAAARALGLSRHTLSAVANGQQAITPLIAVKLAKAFGGSDGLASALATIEQGFGDRWLYPNVASRAAHLLYFVIENHPLADGNKRVGSFLFLCYLHRNQPLLAKPVAQLINENTLVALALLVAESALAQKELMIKLVEHFIELRA